MMECGETLEVAKAPIFPEWGRAGTSHANGNRVGDHTHPSTRQHIIEGRLAYSHSIHAGPTAKMPAADDDKRKAAKETIDILHEISTLLVSHILALSHDSEVMLTNDS